MVRVGIVGGLGPESTIDYYRRILERWKGEDPSTMPPIVIDSLDVTRALTLVATDRAALVDYLRESLRRLAGAGAGFIAMTANTPHIVFDELAAKSPVPLLSIVETCAEEARRRGMHRLLLLGTRFTMEASFYPTVFARHRVDVVVPAEPDRDWIHARYVGELLVGSFREETRREFTALVARMCGEHEIDGVILGGTELPLLLDAPEIAGVPVLDTTALHVAAIVRRMRGGAAIDQMRDEDTGPRRVDGGVYLRRATAADAAAIASLLAELGHPAESVEIPARLAAVLREGGAVILACGSSGEALGLMSLARHVVLHSPGPVAYITALVTASAARRRGVGQRLVAAAKEWAGANDCVRLSVTSAEHRADAHAFYPACGMPYSGRRFAAPIVQPPPMANPTN